MDARMVRFCLALAAVTGVVVGCQKDTPKPPPARPETAFRLHWVGRNALAHDPQAAQVESLWNLPESQAFQSYLLDRLAQAPYEYLHNRTAPGARDNADLLRPLLEDLLRAESYSEMTSVSNGPGEFVLAVRLDDDRARLWSSNLAAVVRNWTGCAIEPADTNAPPGWKCRPHDPPNLIQCVRAGQWLVTGWGQDTLPLRNQILGRINASGQPAPSSSPAWLEAFADWTILARELSSPATNDLPRMELVLNPTNTGLHAKADFTFRHPLSWPPSPWQIPNELVHDPVISFTAARAVKPLLTDLAQSVGLRLENLPDQVFCWAMANVPFLTFAAAPTANATNLLAEIGPQLARRFNPALQQMHYGGIGRDTNTGGIEWRGLPFIVPTATPTKIRNTDYVTIGLLPAVPGTNTAPPELFAQVTGDTNLLYYDWELTSMRLPQWCGLWDMAQTFFHRPRLATNKIADSWLTAISTNLGNTVTKISRTDSNRLTFVRNGPVALTGFELVALVNWTWAPHFPLDAIGLALPPRTNAPSAQAPPKPAR